MRRNLAKSRFWSVTFSNGVRVRRVECGGTVYERDMCGPRRIRVPTYTTYRVGYNGKLIDSFSNKSRALRRAREYMPLLPDA